MLSYPVRLVQTSGLTCSRYFKACPSTNAVGETPAPNPTASGAVSRRLVKRTLFLGVSIARLGALHLKFATLAAIIPHLNTLLQRQHIALAVHICLQCMPPWPNHRGTDYLYNVPCIHIVITKLPIQRVSKLAGEASHTGRYCAEGSYCKNNLIYTIHIDTTSFTRTGANGSEGQA